MEKELSVKKQIEVLKKAKKDISSKKIYCFVCVSSWNVIKDQHYDNGEDRADSSYVSEYIPLLTIENAKIACRESYVTLPKSNFPHDAWWGYREPKPRIIFINWMLKELEKKL
jgi:hypothetical protein